MPFILLFLAAFIWLVPPASAQGLLPNAKQTFLDSNGDPLAAGTVTFYVPGTSTLKNTWSTPTLSVLNTNPVVLDSAGRATLYGEGQYRQIVRDSNGITIWDQLTQAPGFLVGPVLGTATVCTRAKLAAVPITLYTSITRLGFTVCGDAPALVYFGEGGTCAANGRVNDGGSCVDSTLGDNNSWVAEVPPEGLDAREFGADATGTADSTTALQSWGDWASAAEHRTGWLAPGTYKTLSTLTWTGGKNWSLRGAGQGVSTIRYSGASASVDIISVTHAIQLLFEGFGIESTTLMTGGAGLHLNDISYSHFVEITAGQGGKLTTVVPHPPASLWDGIWFENTAWNTLTRASPYVLHDALLVNQGVELNVEDFISINQGRAAIHLAGAFGGLYLGYVSVSCNNTGLYGLLVDNELSAATNFQVFVSNRTVFDICLADNVFINNTNADTTLGLRAFSWDGWASGAGPNVGAAGIHVQNWHNGTVHIGGGATLISNQGSGVLIDDATAIVSIDTAAVINGNAAYGIQCSVPMTTIISDAQNQQGTWNNTLGAYSTNCGGQLARFTWPTFTPTVSCSGGGAAPTVTAVGTYYRYGKKVHIYYDVTLTSGGTCVTSLNLSVPAGLTAQGALITGCTFHGINNVGKYAMVGLSATSTSVPIYKYDGTVQQTNADRFFVDGECQTN